MLKTGESIHFPFYILILFFLGVAYCGGGSTRIARRSQHDVAKPVIHILPIRVSAPIPSASHDNPIIDATTSLSETPKISIALIIDRSIDQEKTDVIRKPIPSLNLCDLLAADESKVSSTSPSSASQDKERRISSRLIYLVLRSRSDTHSSKVVKANEPQSDSASKLDSYMT